MDAAILSKTDNAPPTGPTPGRRFVQCGYDLRGSPAGVCPECGREITSLSESPIPWVHRKAIGRWRAAWRTVWVGTFRARTLIEAAMLPVDYASAQWFRRLIIGWIWLWACVAITTVYLCARLPPLAMPMIDPSQAAQRGITFALFAGAGYLLPPVPMLGLLITLVLGRTSAGFFARPQNVPVWLRNRAVALTRYTVAPLAWLPIAIVAAAVAVDLENYDNWTRTYAWTTFFGGIFIALTVGFFSVIAYGVNTVRVRASSPRT